MQPPLFVDLGDPLVLFADLLRRFGALHHLPSFRFEPLGSETVVNGPLVRVTQNFVSLFGFVEQNFRFFLPQGVRVLIGMVDATQPAVGVGDVFLRCLMNKDNGDNYNDVLVIRLYRTKN